LPGAVLVAALLLPAAPASAETTTRLEGTTTTEAAIAWSEATFADGAAPVVLLARDDDFADALTSNSAQAQLDAPLLLTDPGALSPDTAAELARLDPDEVRILGGDQAVSPAVQTALQGLGYTVSRYFGADRIGTAIAVADALFPNATSAVVARGFPGADPTQAFADAIGAGSYAANAGVPVLLTETVALSPATADYITGSAIESVIVAGGALAVSDAAEQRIEEAGRNTVRLFGSSRGGTAVALNRELGYQTAADAPRVLLVEGTEPTAWASGLAIGAQAGNGAATVLSDGPALFAETVEFLGQGADVPLICGPLVDTPACDAASAALGNEG
jgi:putative cell wall-binding protein